MTSLLKEQLLTLKVLVTKIDAQWEGMRDLGSARYEPALLPPYSTIRALSYSNQVNFQKFSTLRVKLNKHENVKCSQAFVSNIYVMHTWLIIFLRSKYFTFYNL